MVKIILEVDGMACGMCEAHVNDAVRQAISATGYTVRSVRTEPYEKKGFSLFRK